MGPEISNQQSGVKVEGEDLEEEEQDERSWVERVFQSPKFFLINLLYIAGTQGSFYTYFIGVSSTLEKRFSYASSVTTYILMLENLANVFVSPVCGILANKVNKAKFISFGVFLISLGSFLTGCLFLFFGPRNYENDEGGSLMSTISSGNRSSSYSMCKVGNDNEIDCESDGSLTEWPAVSLIFLGGFIGGVGFVIFFVIGYPYADDLLPKKQTPIYFAVISTLRLLGPSLGMLLSAWVTRYPEDILNPNAITDRKDPKFIGAYWIGFFVCSFFTILGAIPMYFFPKSMTRKKPKRRKSTISTTSNGPRKSLVSNKLVEEPVEEEESGLGLLKVSPTEVWASVKRIITNPLWMSDMLSANFRYFALAGYYISKPKYLESQYHKSASDAALFSGTTGLMSQAGGILLGGVFIRYMQPSPKNLTIFIMFVELWVNAALLSGFFLGCPGSQFTGYNTLDDQGVKNIEQNIFSSCNMDCSCSRTVLEPVCSSDNVTNYFSPCFAGCKNVTSFGTFKKTTLFTDCSCEKSPKVVLKSGYCPIECNNFIPYMTIMSVGSLIAATARVGNFLVKVRSIEPRDKAFSIAFSMVVYCLLAGIPYKFVYGKLTDAACMIWQENDAQSSCDNQSSKKGNCWLYDPEKFRNYLHGMSFTMVMIGSFLDCAVIYFAHRMNHLYKDDDELEEEAARESLRRPSVRRPSSKSTQNTNL